MTLGDNMKIKDVLGISNAKLICGDVDWEFKGFSKDTRTIRPHDTYIGIKGENFDGNLFYRDAFFRGADTCILEHLDKWDDIKDKNIILVDNTLEFVMALASLKRKSIHVPVIAITGSVGKTSTKEIVASTLEVKYKVLKTIGNENSLLGMSLRLLNYQDEDIIVLEMGMNQKGEIKKLSQIARPNKAIITNIGTSHIGNLGSRENILKAKLEILEGLDEDLIINNDNDLLNLWQKKREYSPIITFGIHNPSDYQALDVSYGIYGSKYYLNKELVSIPVIGEAFILNSLVAFIIGDMYGISHEQVKNVISKLKLERHRMEFIKKNDYTIIDDTYNASLDSIRSSLDIISYLKGRKIVVLGDVLELGLYGEEIHRNIGKLLNNYDIDTLVTVGSLSEFINIEANIKNNYHFLSNDEAIKCLKKIIKADDIILVKASHGMNFIEIVQDLIK